jgi:hypothetical protein
LKVSCLERAGLVLSIEVLALERERWLNRLLNPLDDLNDGSNASGRREDLGEPSVGVRFWREGGVVLPEDGVLEALNGGDHGVGVVVLLTVREDWEGKKISTGIKRKEKNQDVLS